VAGGSLYALSPDGTNKWQAPFGGVSGSPSIATNGTVYVGSAVDGKLYAISPTGQTNWTFLTGGPIQSSVAVGSDGAIYFGSADGKLYALNRNGAKIWDFAAGQILKSSPSIAVDGTIYIGTQSGKLYAVNADGTQKWALDMPNPVETAPAIGPSGTIYCAVQYEGTLGIRGLLAISPSGTELWRQLNWWPVSSPVVGTDGTVYIVTFNPTQLLALNPTNGAVKWLAGWGGNPYQDLPAAPALADDGLIYYGATAGSGGETNFYAINPDGTTNWTRQTGAEILSSPAVGPDGTVYFGDGFTFYAVNGAAPLANSAWPKYKQNLRNTGRVEKPALKQPQKRSDGGFQFQLQGELGQGYTVLGSTNLNTWTSLTSLVATTVPMNITDFTATNFPVRFYRASSP
jgi:outer membrane protein assembly factor BamB